MNNYLANKNRTWNVLLIGSAAGTGKPCISQRFAQHFAARYRLASKVEFNPRAANTRPQSESARLLGNMACSILNCRCCRPSLFSPLDRAADRERSGRGHWPDLRLVHPEIAVVLQTPPYFLLQLRYDVQCFEEMFTIVENEQQLFGPEIVDQLSTRRAWILCRRR